MNTRNRAKHNYRPLVIAAVSVVVLWALSGLSIIALYNRLPDSPGTFGDMFGAINSLFSGLAFAGLIYTILQQREELDLTRQEFIKQNETFRLQRFENTFFQLLRLNDDLLDGQTITGQHKSVETRVYLHIISEKITEEINKQLGMLKSDVDITEPALSQGGKLKMVKQTLHVFKKEIETSLLHFFNNLFSIIQLVDASQLIDKEEKLLYINILKTQMSVSEKNILFFMLIVWDDMESQKLLYDQYHFLDRYASITFDGLFMDIYRNT